MSAWAKLAGNTWISRDISPASFPNDFWGQVDVWIPPQTFTAGNGDLFGFTASFLDFGNDLLLAEDSGGWKWLTNYGTLAATGPAPSTTYTIKFHYVYGGGSFATVDWYANGTLVAHDPSVNHFSQHLLFLNHQPEGACCEIYYYTNVRVGTSDGAADIINDDFSGGLGAWVRNSPVFQPSGLAFVAAPVAAACPTLTVSPPRGLPGTTFTVTGAGFAPSRPLQLFFGTHELENTASSDGSGNASFTATVPNIPTTGAFDGYDVYLLDDEANVACSNGFAGAGFGVCGTEPADGITTAPDPLVATGGITSNTNEILDYIFHDGAHWVLWQDVSVTTGLTTFPPPANHTMNATRISGDGSSVVDYEIDSGYQWHFGEGAISNPGLGATRSCGGSTVNSPVWDAKFFFSSWEKPILDAHFASDGSSLWVALLTRETVPYSWLDNLDGHDINPGAASQFVPLATLTSGFTSFATNSATGYHRYNTQTTGIIDFYQAHAYPLTDGGEANSGHWSPPLVVMFAFDGAAFNRIGEIDAKYAPGITTGVGYGVAPLGAPLADQKAQRGTLISRVSICASPTDPGRCHVVWSEGGDWGRQALAAPDCSRLVWDSGPPNRGYRVSYTTWSPTAKLTDTDLWSSHVDRTAWWFPNDEGGGSVISVGYSWPDQGNFAGLLNHDLRNDNAAGTPYLFAVWPQSFQNPFELPPDSHGDPWLDQYLVWGDTLHVYDLSSGGAVEVQALDLSTLGMTEAEILDIWTTGTGPPFAPPYGPVDAAMMPPLAFDNNGNPISSYGPQPKGFGISLPYDDPALGVPVYLVHLPLIKRFLNEATSPLPTEGAFPARGFYRIPCDMSDGFDYLDGERLIGFTIVKEPFTGNSQFTFYGSDFFSDTKNIWIPAPQADPGDFGLGFNGYEGMWFDRVCNNQWEPFSSALTPNVVDYWLGSQCPGFYYDPASDSITTVTGPSLAPPVAGPLFAVTTQFICRGCRHCKCGTGVHLAHRF